MFVHIIPDCIMNYPHLDLALNPVHWYGLTLGKARLVVSMAQMD
jgi:hypothetical protein